MSSSLSKPCSQSSRTVLDTAFIEHANTSRSYPSSTGLIDSSFAAPSRLAHQSKTPYSRVEIAKQKLRESFSEQEQSRAIKQLLDICNHELRNWGSRSVQDIVQRFEATEDHASLGGFGNSPRFSRFNQRQTKNDQLKMSTQSPDTTQPSVVQNDNTANQDMLASKPVRPRRRWFGLSEMSISKPESSQVLAGGKIQPQPQKSVSNEDLAAHDTPKAVSPSVSPVPDANVLPVPEPEPSKAISDDNGTQAQEHTANKGMPAVSTDVGEQDIRRASTSQNAIETDESTQATQSEGNEQSDERTRSESHQGLTTTSPASAILVPVNSTGTEMRSRTMSRADTFRSSLSAPSALPKDAVSDKPEPLLFENRLSHDAPEHNEAVGDSPDATASPADVSDQPKTVAISLDSPDAVTPEPDKTTSDSLSTVIPILTLPDDETAATVVQAADLPVIVVPSSDTEGSNIVLTSFPADNPLITTLNGDVPNRRLSSKVPPTTELPKADLPETDLPDTDMPQSFEPGGDNAVTKTAAAGLPGHEAPDIGGPETNLPVPDVPNPDIHGSGLPKTLPTDVPTLSTNPIRKKGVINEIRKLILRRHVLELMLGRELSKVTHAHLKGVNEVTNTASL